MKVNKRLARPVKAETEVATEATELLFETEDVAQLLAEVSGEDVEVTADGDVVTFAIGEDEFTVEAEGDEELVESSVAIRNKKAVAAAARTRRGAVKASTSAKANTKVIRKSPATK